MNKQMTLVDRLGDTRTAWPPLASPVGRILSTMAENMKMIHHDAKFLMCAAAWHESKRLCGSGSAACAVVALPKLII